MRILTTIPNAILSEPREVAAACRRLLFQTVETNVEILRRAALAGHPIPEIYDSGVWFCREPWAGRVEEFGNILDVLERGWADCDDACGWVCAQRRFNAERGAGDPRDREAGIKIYWRLPTADRDMTIHHAQVRLGSGKIEDPSRRLPGG